MKRKLASGLTRVVTVEYRKPRNKYEKERCGVTIISPGNELSTVFINSDKKRDGEAMNTFFHEMTHVWFDQFAAASFPAATTEHWAYLVGNAVEAILNTR